MGVRNNSLDRYIVSMTLLVSVALAGVAGAASKVTFRSERGKGPNWTWSIRYPVFPPTSPLSRRASAEFREAAQGEARSHARGARKSASSNRGGPSTLEAVPTVSLHTNRLISGYYAVDSYAGGAHGINYYLTLNLAVVGGKPRKLALRDLFRPGADPLKLASGLVLARARSIERATSVRDGSVKSLGAPELSNWVLTPSGIVFLFGPYLFGSYADGSFEIKVPYRDFGDALDRSGPLAPLL